MQRSARDVPIFLDTEAEVEPYVRCRHCKDEFSVEELVAGDRFGSYESNEFGEDTLGFVCPNCGEQSTSVVRLRVSQ